MKWVLAGCLCLLASCAERTPSTTQPTDQAVNDPFNYSPKMDDTDVSGGKINEFDKDAFKRDLDHVFNP